MSAIQVSGRFFILENPEKLLYHWASVRNIQKDIAYSIRTDLPVFEIEGRMPPGAVFGTYSAARMFLSEAPADYDKVYVYHPNPQVVRDRFEAQKGQENLIILRADNFLTTYGSVTTPCQTFVDLWNLSDWYAEEFVRALKEQIDELLS